MQDKITKNDHDMLQIVINNIPQHIFWKDRNSVFLGCNMNFAKAVGLNCPEDIIGKTDYDLTDKENAELFIKTDKEVMENNRTIYGKIVSIKDSKGKKMVMCLNKVPIYGEDGEINGLVGTFENITEKVALEEKMKKNEEKYRSLIEATNTAYVIMDMDLNILETNKIFSDLIQCKNAKDIINKNPRAWIMERDIEKFDYAFGLLTTGKPINNMEIGIINGVKKNIFVTVSANLIENGDKKIFCLIRDVTDKKEKDYVNFIEEQKQKDRIKQNINEIRNKLRKIRMVP